MTTSKSQRTANRDNAQRSTGPRTAEGKKRSSLNALRHGLTSQVIVMPYEDMQAYLAFSQKYIADLDAQTEPERQIDQDLANTQWRITRCHSIECGIFAIGQHDLSEPVNTGNSQIHAALTAAKVYVENGDPLENLSRHENRLRRNFQSTLQQLHALQDRRRESQHFEVAHAIRIYKTHRMQGLPYHPAADGFVLSVAQIEDHMARKQRSTDAKLAENLDFDVEKFRAAKAV